MSAISKQRAGRVLAAFLCLSPAALAAQQPLTEERAIALALSREGIAARDEANRAEAAAEIAMIGPLENPEIELAREAISGESEWYLGVVQPLDLSGSRSALRDAARSDAQAVEHEIAWRRQQLVAEARQAFASCAAAGAEEIVWRDYASGLKDAANSAGVKTSMRDDRAAEGQIAQMAISKATADLSLAEAEKAATCAALSTLTGEAEPRIEVSALEALRSGVASASRADLAAQRQRIHAAGGRVSAARRAQVPQFALGAGVKRVDDGSDVAYGPVLGLGMSLPLWNGGRAEVAAAEAQRRALEAELAIAQRTADAERHAAAIRAKAARDALGAAARARHHAATALADARTGHEAGAADIDEVLSAHEAWRDSELDVIARARLAAETAIALDLANGRVF